MADTEPQTATAPHEANANDTTPNSPYDAKRANQHSIILHPQSQHTGFFKRFRSSIFFASFALLLSPLTFFHPSSAPVDPTDYAERTRRVLKTTPLIDGHNDLPWILRIELQNRIYGGKVDFEKRLLGHTDIQRMKQGMVGGQFWSVYVHCDTAVKHFEDPSWVVRDTLEQIDVTKRFIVEHADYLQYCADSACVRQAFKNGRVASMIGIEGAHQVGGSIASIRQVYELGARYITLTHNCDNAFATATSSVAAGGPDNGLSTLGYEAIKEMNRIGMIVDLSHVSHQTMRDVLSVARAPVVFSHSGAYTVTRHLRNVPDDVLRTVKKNNGLIMAVFVNRFLRMKHPEEASIHDVVDHILHIASVAGWEHVGLGSDFSGTPYVPVGLEDVSKFPDLIELLMEKGATDEQIRLLVGENLLRVWGAIEDSAKEIQATGELPVEAEYEGRRWDLGVKDAPYMLRGSREKAIKAGAADKPFMFNVDDEGKHDPLEKGV
ncbi:hypothetical protein LTR36_007876 [Oleoguttula mirabilis]|uniref:Dipeptidase n=1 Tax=Oleoguttula mirabilis TaxID=1507867 RepID=A0AAV9J9F4_9PEZI|nr:hypothetical protein LTR36_007876 [Oleoguttula mirabilis]